jgi:hypothetical protein
MRTLVAAVVLCFLAPPAAAQPAEGVTEAELLLAVSSAGEEGGATRVGASHVGRLARGRARTFSYVLEPTRCYVAVARGGPGIENLDIEVRRGRTVLARDSGTGPGALARHCAGDRPESVRLGVSAFRGAGQFAAALYVAPASESAPAANVEGEGALARLASLVTQHSRGMRAVSPPARESLREGQSVERTVAIAPGRCYRVLAASEGGVLDLDVAVRGPDGARLAGDTTDGPTVAIGVTSPFCPAMPGEHVLALAVERGEGAFAWQVLGSSDGGSSTGGSSPRSSFRVGGTGTSYVATRIRARHGEVGEGGVATTDLALRSARTHETVEHRFEVEPGRCYRVLAAAVPSVRDLDLEVRDHLGNVRGQDRGATSTPAVRACASVEGTWTARVYMFQGYGQYGIQVFSADN